MRPILIHFSLSHFKTFLCIHEGWKNEPWDSQESTGNPIRFLKLCAACRALWPTLSSLFAEMWPPLKSPCYVSEMCPFVSTWKFYLSFCTVQKFSSTRVVLLCTGEGCRIKASSSYQGTPLLQPGEKSAEMLVAIPDYVLPRLKDSINLNLYRHPQKHLT